MTPKSGRVEVARNSRPERRRTHGLKLLAQYILTAFLLFGTCWSTNAAPDRPLIFIPGILGSKLCERATGRIVWGDRRSLLNFALLELPVQYDPDKLSYVPCGIISSIAILGPWRAHEYDDLFDTFKNVGFQVGKDLFVFDYDWRLSNRVNAANFDRFVAKNIPAGDFDIVAHSMGGLVAKLWLAQSPNAQRTKRLVTLGTPFFGSAATIHTIESGWGFWANLAAGGLSTIREATLTFPSVYEMLPSYPDCCEFATQGPAANYFDIFDATKWQTFEWLPASLQSKERIVWLTKMLADAKAISQVQLPSSVKLIPFANALIDTPWRVIFDKDNGKPIKFIPRGGDGTVYDWSAANGDRSDLRAALAEHQRLFADGAARTVIAWILTGGTEQTSGFLNNIKAELQAADGQIVHLKGVRFEIKAPVSKPFDQNAFEVELTGAELLSQLNLSNITAYLADAGGKKELQGKILSARVEGGDGIVHLSFLFRTPSEIGPYSVTLRLPNVIELSDTGYVLVEGVQ